MKQLKLRTKFVLLLSAVSLAPLALTALLTFSRFQAILEQDAQKLGHQLTATAAAEIKLFVVSQLRIMDTVAAIYNPQLSNESGAAEKVVENILYRSDSFTDISIADKNGKEIVKQDRILVITPGDLKDLKETPAFKTVKEKGIYVGPIYINGGKPIFDLGRWITDSQGTFYGAIFARVDAKILPQVMRKVSDIAGPGGRVYLVNEKGIVVAHPDLSYILGEKDLSGLPPISNIVAGNTDIEISKTYYNENSEYVLGSAYPIRIEPLDLRLPEPFQLNWFLIAEQQARAVFAEAYQLAWFFALISLLVIGLAIGTAIFFARKISAPVEKLHIATEKFAEGDLAYRTGINSGDEIGDLARSFDTMAGTLAKSIQNLRLEEKIISAEKNKLSIILSGISNAVIAVDLERKIILFNKAAESLTGLSAKEVMGKSVQETIKIFDQEKELSADEYCPIGKNRFEGIVFSKNNLKFNDAGGQEHYINLISGTIREGLDIQLGCILTIQDTTREFLIEKTKSEFISVAAHQLRTPLTGIKWSLKSLFSGETGELSQEQKKLVGETFSATDRMIDLVNDLLNVSRIEEGRFGIRLEKQSISPVFENIQKTFRSIASEKNITLKIDSPSPGPLLNIDKEKLEVVLNNLIDNAILYSPPGAEVRVKTEARAGEFIITVKDSGIGISKSDSDRIFTKFFRSRQALLNSPSGSGLGLYVAKNIIEQHGGKIRFESPAPSGVAGEENKGTIFYVSIPIDYN